MVEYYIFIVILIFVKVLFWIVFCSVRAQPKEKRWGMSSSRPRRVNDRASIIDCEVPPDESSVSGLPSNTGPSSLNQPPTYEQAERDLHHSYSYSYPV